MFSETSTSPTLWAGTNSGQVLVFLLTLPKSNRQEDKVNAILGKEIQLKHRAPVLTIQVLDSQCLPVSVSSPASSEGPPHKVLIASEEQFKMFVLPTLKPCGKYKLTAHEGALIRKIGFTTFKSKSDGNYSENCVTCLTNQGDLVINSLPELRRQVLQTKVIKKENVIGISSLVFTPWGEAFYPTSSSELARISMAASLNLQPRGTLVTSGRFEIKDGKKSKRKSETLPPPPPVGSGALASSAKKASTASSTAAEDAVEAATVARQNQINEQQAQGNFH